MPARISSRLDRIELLFFRKTRASRQSDIYHGPEGGLRWRTQNRWNPSHRNDSASLGHSPQETPRVRRSLTAEGTYLVQEINLSSELNDNLKPSGKLAYSFSTLYCMTTSLAHGGAGIGAAMGEPKAGELAAMAGFSRFKRLPIQDDFAVFYELRP
jgi:hypothetical protein